MNSIDILKSKYNFYLSTHTSIVTNDTRYFVKVNGKEKELTKEEYEVLLKDLRKIKCQCCGKEIKKGKYYASEDNSLFYCEKCGDEELTYSYSFQYYYENAVLFSERTAYYEKEVGKYE